jgi:hypothetical protein
MAEAYAYSTRSSWRNTLCGTSSTRTAALQGFRDEAKPMATWRSVGRRNMASVTIVAAPDTALGIVALPGKIRPLANALHNDSKTMDAGILGRKEIRDHNATNVKPTVIFRVIVQLKTPVMRHPRLVITETTDARTCVSPSEVTNALHFNARLA